MKQFKKILTLALVLVLALSVMSLTAFAADGTTITINPSTPTDAAPDSAQPTYTYYVFMKASIGAGNAVSYYVETEALANALDALKVGDADLFTVTKAAGANQWYVTINKKDANANTEFTGEEVAAALATIKSNASATGTATKGADNSTISLAYDAYVLIESSLGTKLIVDTYKTNTVNEKNTYPKNTKTEDKSTAEIGEVVTYTVTVDIPANVAEKPITVVDTITNGLTLNPTITVTGSADTLTFTQTGTVAAVAADSSANPPVAGSKAATVYTAEIPAATVKANAGKTLTLTYTATVNENAVVNDPEINKAHIEYDNFKTVDVAVEVKTFGFDLEKVDKDNHNTKLKDVEFKLTRDVTDNGTTTTYYYTPGTDSGNVNEARFVATEKTVKTDENGKISFVGLHAGTYTLTEVSNPNSGYNMLASAITVIVSDDGNITVADGGTVQSNVLIVENGKGTVLPSTGGIGTTIFYVVGGLLLVGAGVVLVTRKRVDED